ncbi:MAG: hypothetical protein HYY20_11115 [Candidatus Tectomicrobia bacterium]|uniref:Uncharacterized protein n=1 Tax=Tectimicrobiota bacterium TaxID=2528274 RepID=A0A932CQ29_UNCTE|nr:hypothetical protein [Candidatus Tectomicrobia bacterium]
MERLGSCSDRLIAELEDCWRDQRAILESQLRQLGVTSITTPEGQDLGTFQKERGEIARTLLLEPLTRWERRRPYERALVAIETYDRSLEKLVSALPEAVLVSGPQALGLLGERASRGQRRLALLRRRERALPLKAIVAEELRKLSRLRSKVEGRYLLALALSLRQLKRPWEVARAALDASAQGQPWPGRSLELQWEETKSSTEMLIQHGESALSEWRAWYAAAARRLARSVLVGVVWGGRRKTLDFGDRRAVNLARWAEKLRAVEAEVRLEAALERSEGRLLALFQRALEGLISEQTSLLAGLDEAMDWLREQIEQDSQGVFPLPKAGIVPASSRLSELEAGLRAELQTLPQSCEIVARLSASPRRRTPWKKLYPRETLYHAFVRTGRTEIARVLEEIEAEHRKIVQEIERAREPLVWERRPVIITMSTTPIK